MSAPLPTTDSYVAATRSSCLAASTSLGITPNIAAIDAFLTNLSRDSFDQLKTQHGLSFPLLFPTPTAEINFLSILSLLNAYSGYRVAFHRATGAGTYQNIVRLMIGLYIGGGEEDPEVGSKSLTARGMTQLTEAKIIELLGVSVHEEKPHDSLPGVTVGVRGGAMLEVVQLILETVQGVGRRLVEMNQSSLGSFVVGVLKHMKQAGMDDTQATDHFVRQMAVLPEFQDTHRLAAAAGQDVYIFKRIFILLHSLSKFAGSQEWMVPDTVQTLPMFVDNVLPTLCVWYDLFDVAEVAPEGMQTLYDWVRSKHCNADLPREKLQGLEKNVAGPELSKDETYAIRAATLNVGRVVVERAKALAQEPGKEWLQGMNEVDLDGYLWAVAKDDVGLRKVPRLVFKSIHF